VTPLRALIILIFLLENDMWGLVCYIQDHRQSFWYLIRFWKNKREQKNQQY